LLSTANTFTGGVQQITTASASTKGLIVKGAASMTANLQEWQNSAGTVLTNITSGGNIVFGRNGGAALGSAAFTVQNATAFVHYSTDNTAVRVTAATFLRGNTTGNAMSITQLGDAANGVAAITINNTGNVEVFRIGQTGDTINTLSNPATIGSIIKGAASQTADLQQWRNSAGSVLVSINSTGTLTTSGDLNTSAGFLRIAGNAFAGTENSGTSLRFLKANAQSASPGANNARVYFRDGTNAGTLKLVVRAGAAGAETTILDNIPQ
jgi:hypothetical protein